MLVMLQSSSLNGSLSCCSSCNHSQRLSQTNIKGFGCQIKVQLLLLRSVISHCHSRKCHLLILLFQCSSIHILYSYVFAGCVLPVTFVEWCSVVNSWQSLAQPHQHLMRLEVYMTQAGMETESLCLLYMFKSVEPVLSSALHQLCRNPSTCSGCSQYLSHILITCPKVHYANKTAHNQFCTVLAASLCKHLAANWTS